MCSSKSQKKRIASMTSLKPLNKNSSSAVSLVAMKLAAPLHGRCKTPECPDPRISVLSSAKTPFS
jgi:hypothetical protein